MEQTAFSATISGKPYTIGVLAVTPPAPEAAPAASRTHHVWLIDRSYSMQRVLYNLTQQVKTGRKRVGPEDLFTLLWFSSVGEFSEIVVGAKASDDIDKLIDKLAQPVGSTCFSQVLNKAVEIAERFSDVVDQTSATLFTDGQPCLYGWSSEEEINRSKAAVTKMRQVTNLVAFNTIGYTPYYNRDFLNELVSLTEHGRFVHTMDIEDFLETITYNIETASKLVTRKVSLSVLGAPQDILYVGEGSSSLRGGSFSTAALSPSTNLFFTIFPEDAPSKRIAVEDSNAGDGGTVFDFTAIKGMEKTPAAMKDDFFYAYAAKLYAMGRRRDALDIIVHNVHDKGLATTMMNAYSIVEVGDAQNALEAAANDRTQRLLEGKAGPGFMPAANAFCLMDLFGEFFKAPGKVFFIPQSDRVAAYKRVGRKVSDSANAFTQDRSVEVRTPVSELIWNKERLNLSVLTHMSGTVQLNPASVKRVNDGAAKPLPNPFPSGIFRAYTIVKDGTINMEDVEFLIEQGLYASLIVGKVPHDLVKEDPTAIIDGQTFQRVILHLNKLPIINRLYMDKANDLPTLHDLVERETVISAQSKVAKALLDRVVASSATMTKVDAFAGYTKDQIQVLEDHGISDKGIYGGIDNKRPTNDETTDSYVTRKMAFNLKGTANLPSVSDLDKYLAARAANEADPSVKAPKAPNYGLSLMVAYYDRLVATLTSGGFTLDNPTVGLRDLLKQEVDVLGTEMAKIRQEINLTKLAKILNNDWFPGVQTDDRGNQTYSTDGKPDLVLKTERILEKI